MISRPFGYSGRLHVGARHVAGVGTTGADDSRRTAAVGPVQLQLMEKLWPEVHVWVGGLQSSLHL